MTTSPAAFLLRIYGDVDRFVALLKNDETTSEYELLRVTETETYCFVTGIGTPDARALWENFKRGSLMTVPPAEWNVDGSYTFTLVGRDTNIQTAIECLPSTVRVEIELVEGHLFTDRRISLISVNTVVLVQNRSDPYYNPIRG